MYARTFSERPAAGAAIVYNVGVMSAVDDILKRAKQLPAKEKRRIVRQLQADLAPPKPKRRVASPRRRTATNKGLAMFVAMSGTGHSDYTDVASNKGKHLADVYAPKR